MAKKSFDRSRKRELPLWASISLIVVLGLGATALVYSAFKQVNSDSENQSFSTVDSVGVEPMPVPTPSKDTSAENSNSEELAGEKEETRVDSSGEELDLVVPTRLIALDGDSAVRATVGECGAGNRGSLEFSQDGGGSWNPSPGFEQTDATQVLRLLPSASARTYVVALNEDCLAQIYSTADGGQTWDAPVAAVGTWYLNPASPRQLGAPGGVRNIECDAASLSPVTDSTVGVLCVDGSVITTLDSGTTWTEPVPSPGALVLAYSKEQLMLASQGREACEGISLESVNRSGASCIPTGPVEFEAGELALAQSGNSFIAWGGESVVISKDGGQTWE